MSLPFLLFVIYKPGTSRLQSMISFMLGILHETYTVQCLLQRTNILPNTKAANIIITIGTKFVPVQLFDYVENKTSTFL